MMGIPCLGGMSGVGPSRCSEERVFVPTNGRAIADDSAMTVHVPRSGRLPRREPVRQDMVFKEEVTL